MNATTRVDFHSHSVHSDGALTPREVAECMAGAGVAAAALTDHNTLDGLEEFQRALAVHEIGFIPGVEISTFYGNIVVHLLAYGIDTANDELLAILASLRQANTPQMQSITDSIRMKGAATNGAVTTPDGRLDTADAIALIHRAGGRAFFAHPLMLEDDFGKLETMLVAFKAMGLDGIEGIYGRFSENDRQHLCEMAQRHGLLVSAGTDLHDRNLPAGMIGIDMPMALWKSFRDAVCTSDIHTTPPAPLATTRPRPRFKWWKFVSHFMLPTLLAIVLFIGAIFAIILPTFERSLLDRKREMIRELTNSAWSILADAERDEKSGRLSKTEAQAMAISRIEALRYGSDRKDYFWLQDMQPKMIMHPYRKDLNGQDVSTFRDPRGEAIFKEFVNVVKQHHEGYAQYVWQWNDDPGRLVPKESYVKGFEPWGWIIGTGIYIEDVTLETKRIERSLVQTSLLISTLVVLLLLYVLFESLRLERERADTEESLRASTERYRSLVEAATEGTLLLKNGRCRYANRTFLEMLGSSQRELELLDLTDLFPMNRDNETAWIRLNEMLRGEDSKGGFDAVMQRRDGSMLECVLIPNRIDFTEKDSFILLARPVAQEPDTDTAQLQHWQYLHQVVDELPVAIFRARANARGTILAHNQATSRLLFTPQVGVNATLSLADAFNSQAHYDEFLDDLLRDGTAERHLYSTSDGTNHTVAIVATLACDENGAQRYINGVAEDITAAQARTAAQEAIIEQLQSTLLFLHEPVKRSEYNVVFCALETSIHTVATLMTDQHTSVALIQSEKGKVVGIVTDSDIRQRCVATEMNRDEPVYRIMNSPLVTIAENAEIYEALLLLEREQLQHLAITDETGRVVGVVHSNELMQFRHYSPMVLTREVEQATTPAAVVRACQRVPALTKSLLDSGAHPQMISHMVTAICDAATVRLIALAEKELGPSPVPFAFLAFGSHGRQEMTIASDQDNAIIYQDVADATADAGVKEYMQVLASFVCGWLDKAGYPLCKGNVLAQNPRWCQPLATWKQYFSNWIACTEPQQLLEFTIFFDFRPVYGDTELSRELREHLIAQLQTRPIFYPHFAQNALLFKPPTRLFGRLIGGGGEHADLLDFKDAVIPIISFARLYALRENIATANTLERLHELMLANVLTTTSAQDISDAYKLLMRLRLRQHITAAQTGSTPSNVINPRQLSQAEQTLLNLAFTQIIAIQQRINYDFLGGTG